MPRDIAARIGESNATPTERHLSRRWPIISGALALLIAGLIVPLVLSRNGDLPFGFDTEFLDEMIENRGPVLDFFAHGMDFLGGGVVGIYVVPLAIIAVLLIIRRPWAAIFFTISTVLSAGAVQLIKNVVGRPRPEDMLVTSDYGSFPSGHTANAATLAVALGIIFPKVWVWIAGLFYTVLMLLSRTYLGAHWLSDTLGGLLIGVGVALIVWAPFATRLRGEPIPRASSGGPTGSAPDAATPASGPATDSTAR